MCVAGLHLSTQACSHRWYNLVRNCQDTNNLANCPEKLKIEGWESRTDTCPWCDGEATHESTHKLLGGSSSSTSPSSSPTFFEPWFARPIRTDSGGTLCSLSSLSRHSSIASTESDMGQRHRNMNERLNLYLLTHPHELLPSAAKNYPTTSQLQSLENTSADEPMLRRADSGLKRRLKNSVRMSRSIFSV